MLNSLSIISQLPKTSESLHLILPLFNRIPDLIEEVHRISEIEKTKRKLIEAKKEVLIKVLDEYFKEFDKIVEKKFEEREKVINTHLYFVEFLKENIEKSLKGELKEEEIELLVTAFVEALKLLVEVLEKPVITEEEAQALKIEIFEKIAVNKETLELPEVLEL